MGEPVGQVRMRIVGDEVGTDLRGPTACELYTPADLEDLVARLGPDPLRSDATRSVRGRRSTGRHDRSAPC